MRKRVVCVVLGLVMVMSQTMTVLAVTESQLRERKNQAESQLNNTYAVIDDLSEQQMQVQSEINAMDADLVDLMVQIDAAKTDIANTEIQIAETEANIEAKKAEIKQTKEDLRVAEDNRSRQYEDMKKRIQYIYENGGDAAWVQMIFQEDFSKMLNRAEYAQSLHDYDREKLKEYAQVVKEITKLKKDLEQQQKDLEAHQAALQEQKASFEAQKADLEQQQAELQAQINEKKAVSSDYADRIASARQQAQEISNLIARQEAELERLAEERRQAEEAARRAAEEEAARRAAAEEEARRAAEEAEQASRQREEEEANEERDVEAAEESDASESSSEEESSYEEERSESSSSAGYSAGGSSGSSIVAYADQFVGNPYVWGGNSLTNGIDCSHFVYQVLKNCGVYSGGYTTSGGWRGLGRAVGSLSEARAGDVICYSGHVAIYDGSGGIVEAKGSRWGITHDRSANCKTILAIRRFT